ncbi:MAG: asparagine synthase (glutamine-hydrolyzing) [Hungateiclostridium thermocellum]|nr:asparagine synthase (glutamine-hydrolyzing) [Acetivibrio thermocellus]
MCGIAGWIDSNRDLRNYEDIINKMTGTLVRRGPDAQGIYLKENVCLMHRRLIVIDPVTGIQPMTKEKGNTSYTIVYNGELYNTNELRDELIAFGYHFRGHSDTEVLLTAFIHWGESCLERLNGIYAFGVWNDTSKTLFLARDRMGVKPLFVYSYHDGIIFGSELKTLLANPLVKHRVDNDGLKEILLLGPGRTSGNGVIKGVTELKPAEFLVFEQKTGLKVRKYWSLKASEHTDDVKTTIEKTRFLITDAVKRQLVSDVPLCCFLSGGLDSSIISKIASDEYLSGNKGRLHTYSVNYVDNHRYFVKSIFQPNSDEKYIRMMGNVIGSQHHEVLLDNEDLEKHLGDAVLARDLPGMADVDSSLLLFCREIKKEFTVAVSGECADEIFGGYPWYHNRDILFKDTFPWSQSLDLRQSILKPGLLKDGEEYVKQQYSDTVNNTDILPGEEEVEVRMRQMFMLNLNWFMQTLLDRKDRMSMYSGLEVRVPFCDHRLVEYAYNMPWHIKSLNGREKGIVREAMKGILPDEIISRKKSPYPKTHNPKYLKAVKSSLQKILNDSSSPLAQLINIQKVQEIIDSDGKSLSMPWYGQLMTGTQLMAYLIQVDIWMRAYKIEIV